jgi:hypothetical protein
MTNRSDSTEDKSLAPPLPHPEATVDAERARTPPEPPYRPYAKIPVLSDPAYRPYAKKPGLSEAPYEPYPKKPGQSEPPYEPYKDI